MSTPPADRSGPQVFLVLLALVAFLALVGGVSHLDDPDPEYRTKVWR